jgi:hypothetical protein
MSLPAFEPAMPDFWQTEAGVETRLQLLESSLEAESFNLAVVTNPYGLMMFQISGPLDDRTCFICSEYAGQAFRKGEYMPELPIHPNCRHFWEIVPTS